MCNVNKMNHPFSILPCGPIYSWLISVCFFYENEKSFINILVAKCGIRKTTNLNTNCSFFPKLECIRFIQSTAIIQMSLIILYWNQKWQIKNLNLVKRIQLNFNWTRYAIVISNVIYKQLRYLICDSISRLNI